MQALSLLINCHFYLYYFIYSLSESYCIYSKGASSFEECSVNISISIMVERLYKNLKSNPLTIIMRFTMNFTKKSPKTQPPKNYKKPLLWFLLVLYSQIPLLLNLIFRKFDKRAKLLHYKDSERKDPVGLEPHKIRLFYSLLIVLAKKR